jgi:hypothetical protein
VEKWLNESYISGKESSKKEATQNIDIEIGDNVKFEREDGTESSGVVMGYADDYYIIIDSVSGKAESIYKTKVDKEANAGDIEDMRNTPSSNFVGEPIKETKAEVEDEGDIYKELESYRDAGISKEEAIEDFKRFYPGMVNDEALQSIADEVYASKEAGGQIDRTKDQRETPSTNFVGEDKSKRVLIGGKRFGKTFFLNQIAKQLEDRKKK